MASCHYSRQAVKIARTLDEQQQQSLEMVGVTGEFETFDNSNRRRDRVYRMLLPFTPIHLLERCVGRAYWVAWVFWILAVPSLLIIGIVLVLHVPRAPVTSICYDGFDWTKIMNNIEVYYTSKLYADYELLVSLYNPNRVDLNVTSLSGVVYFPPHIGGTQVGSILVQSFFAPAGYVTDIKGVLSFDMDKYVALNLGRNYQKGKLELGIDLSLGLEVKAHGLLVFWASRFDLQRSVVNVNAPSDRTYCKCEE